MVVVRMGNASDYLWDLGKILWITLCKWIDTLHLIFSVKPGEIHSGLKKKVSIAHLIVLVGSAAIEKAALEACFR